jgi:hypothetical protein
VVDPALAPADPGRGRLPAYFQDTLTRTHEPPAPTGTETVTPIALERRRKPRGRAATSATDAER